jgi:hypothetical protein
MLHDRRQHLLRIKTRAHRLGNLAQSVQLIDGAPERLRPLIELLHQARVPDGNCALRGERRRKSDLALRERVGLAPPKRDDRDNLVFALDRNANDRPEPSEPLPKALLLGVVLAIIGDVRRHHGSALKRHPADNCAWAWRDLPLPDQRPVLLGAARGTGQPKVVSFLDKHLPGVCLT